MHFLKKEDLSLNNLFFYIPYLYRFHTRECGKMRIIPFLVTDFLPVIFFLYYSLDTTMSILLLICMLLSYFSMFDLYEIGYIINDAITIKYEGNPTMRLNESEIEYAQKNILLIISIRLLIYVFLTSLLLLCLDYNVDLFFIANIMMLCAYSAHNYFRNRIKYITDIILNISKYAIPFIIFLPLNNYIPFCLLLFTFPLVRSLFYVLQREYKKWNNVSDKIQCIVFLFFSLFSFILFEHKIIYFGIFAYYLFFFLYRFFIVVIRVK